MSRFGNNLRACVCVRVVDHEVSRRFRPVGHTLSRPVDHLDTPPTPTIPLAQHTGGLDFHSGNLSPSRSCGALSYPQPYIVISFWAIRFSKRRYDVSCLLAMSAVSWIDDSIGSLNPVYQHIRRTEFETTSQTGTKRQGSLNRVMGGIAWCEEHAPYLGFLDCNLLKSSRPKELMPGSAQGGHSLKVLNQILVIGFGSRHHDLRCTCTGFCYAQGAIFGIYQTDSFFTKVCTEKRVRQ